MAKIKINLKQSDRPTLAVKTAVDRLSSVFAQVESGLIDRSKELEALNLCLLAKGNLLLHGLPGVGKSRLVDDIFSRIEGANIFSMQLTKGTQLDELFGPLDAKRYQERAEWHRNVDGYLPTADYAYLDEVYRGPDMLLPAMLRVLNEREYFNGSEIIPCPLKTAVGTCNFQTDNPELEAIHDRWLVHIEVKPISTSPNRIKMLMAEYERRMTPKPVTATITAKDLELLQYWIDQVVVTEQVIGLYEELVKEYKTKKGGNTYISDRRLCWALRIAQASYLLSKPAQALNKVAMPVPKLLTTHFGLLKVNDDESMAAWGDASTKVIGTFVKQQEEIELMDKLESASKKCRDLFDEKMSKVEAKKLGKNVFIMLSGLKRIPCDKRPTDSKNAERFGKVIEDLSSLALSLQEMGIKVPVPQERTMDFNNPPQEPPTDDVADAV